VRNNERLGRQKLKREKRGWEKRKKRKRKRKRVVGGKYLSARSKVLSDKLSEGMVEGAHSFSEAATRVPV
jgi:hypothetical protein